MFKVDDVKINISFKYKSNLCRNNGYYLVRKRLNKKTSDNDDDDDDGNENGQ